MPTYDYLCETCGHTFDAFQRMSEDALTDCPHCERPDLRRLIGSGAGIIFKGSGFYETDYKRAKSGGESKSQSDGAAKSESKTESKSESKKTESSGGT